MRAISLYYEFIVEILAGSKTEEYRSTNTKLGDMLFCSTKATDPSGLARMYAIVEISECNGGVWTLDNVRPVKQALVSGKQGIWHCPDHSIEELGQDKAERPALFEASKRAEFQAYKPPTEAKPRPVKAPYVEPLVKARLAPLDTTRAEELALRGKALAQEIGARRQTMDQEIQRLRVRLAIIAKSAGF